MERPSLVYIQTLSRGDKSFEEKIIKLIKTEFPKEVKKYFDALKRKKYLKAAEHVHKIRHKLSILGLKKSYELAEEYEHDLRKNKAKLEDEFNTILFSITNYINTL